jgi:hypothetical protein
MMPNQCITQLIHIPCTEEDHTRVVCTPAEVLTMGGFRVPHVPTVVPVHTVHLGYLLAVTVRVTIHTDDHNQTSETIHIEVVEKINGIGRTPNNDIVPKPFIFKSYIYVG